VQLRIAIARRGVEVVQFIPEHELERPIRFGLGDFAERRRAEDRPAALMSGAAEWGARDHDDTIVRR
jgi:hypothetical protein